MPFLRLHGVRLSEGRAPGAASASPASPSALPPPASAALQAPRPPPDLPADARSGPAAPSPPGAGTAHWSRGGRWTLALIVVLAAALRAWGLGFGLDVHDPTRAVLANQVDERGMAESVLDGLLAGRLDPGEFLFRGPGGFLVFGALDAAALLPAALAHEQGWTGLRADLRTHLSRLVLLHRCWSALAGLATVLVLARLARRCAGERAGLAAAALAASCYLLVRESHLGTMDVLLGLAFAGSLDALFDVARGAGRDAALRAGLWAGAAAAIKYFGGVLVLHVLIAHALAARRPASGRAASRLAGPAVTALGMLAGFLVLSPVLLHDPREMLDKVRWSLQSFGTRPGASTLLELAGYHARVSLWAGLGGPACVLAAWGCWRGLRRDGPLRVLALFALASLPCVLAIELPTVRYAVPLALALLPLAAVGGMELLAPLLAAPGRASRALALAALAGCALPGLVRSLAFDARVARTDTRTLVLEHLARVGAPRDDVLAFGAWGLPRMPPGVAPPYIDAYRTLREQPALLRRVREDPPPYLLWEPCAARPSAWDEIGLTALLDTRYRQVLRADGRVDPKTDCAELIDSGVPTHVMPFARPWLVDGPGPPLLLYERIGD